jgi:hypothetical protein
MPSKIITICIAEIFFTFQLNDLKMAKKILYRYKYFISNISGRNFMVRCIFSKKPFDSFNKKISLEQNKNHWHAKRYDFELLWNSKNGIAKLFPSIYSFDAILRILLANRLMLKNGVLVHGASLVKNNNAFSFLGPSGSGKTTICKIAHSDIILSDEITAIKINKKIQKAFVYSTPFWGEMKKGNSPNKSFRLEYLFFIKKNKSLKLLPISFNDAILNFLKCVCIFGNNIKEIKRAFQISTKILLSVNYAKLYFPKSKLDWKTIFNFSKYGTIKQKNVS